MALFLIVFLPLFASLVVGFFGKKLNLLDENFFFKYETLTIKNIFDYIKK